VEAYALGTGGFKELPDGAGTGFDVHDYMAKVRVSSDRSGVSAGKPHPESHVDSYQELELKLKLGYTTEASDATYLGLTDDDFGLNPLARYPASGSDLMEAAHSQIQLRHFWARGNVDVTTTAYRNDFSRNWYKLQSVLGTSISRVLGTPGDHASALSILKGGSSAPDALRVRANNREYFGQGLQSTLGLTLGMHEIELGARFHQDEEDRFQWEDGFQMLEGSMSLTSVGEPGTQSNRVSSATAVAAFLQDEITLGPWMITPGVRFERIEFQRVDYVVDDPARTSPTRTRVNRVHAWIPGVGFSYRARALSFFGGVHRGFGPPGPGADEATRPESSVNYEMGVRWRRSGLAAEATGFLTSYGNILGQATLATGGDGSGQSFNGGYARVAGVEAAPWTTISRGPLPGSRGCRYGCPIRLLVHRFGPGSSPTTIHGARSRPAISCPICPCTTCMGASATTGRLGVSPSPRTPQGRCGQKRGLVLFQGGKGPIPMSFSTPPARSRSASTGPSSRACRTSPTRFTAWPAGLRPGLPRTFVAGVRVEGVR